MSQEVIFLGGNAGFSSTATTGSRDWRDAKEKLERGEKLRTAEVGALFGVTDQTVASWIRKGDLVAEESVFKANSKKGWLVRPEIVRAALGWPEEAK